MESRSTPQTIIYKYGKPQYTPNNYIYIWKAAVHPKQLYIYGKPQYTPNKYIYIWKAAVHPKQLYVYGKPKYTPNNYIYICKAAVHPKQLYIRYRTNVGNYTISTKVMFPYFYYPN